MPEIESYPTGTFRRVELSTHDAGNASLFCTTMLGWIVKDGPTSSPWPADRA